MSPETVTLLLRHVERHLTAHPQQRFALRTNYRADRVIAVCAHGCDSAGWNGHGLLKSVRKSIDATPAEISQAIFLLCSRQDLTTHVSTVRVSFGGHNLPERQFVTRFSPRKAVAHATA